MYYNARWYDPALGRFTQADTIIPGAGNPMAWDRYAYVYNNPVSLSDPSGHMICDMNGNCGGSGSSVLTQAISRTFFETGQQMDLILHNVQQGQINDLQAFCLISDYVASGVVTTDQYMSIMSYYFLGRNGGLPIEIEMFLIEEGILSYNSWFSSDTASKFGQSGYNAGFQDGDDAVALGGGNQSYHYWFYVETAYESGAQTAFLGNVLHETIVGNIWGIGKSWQDFGLGLEGAVLGQNLALGLISPSEVGEYSQVNIGENAPRGNVWLYLENASRIMWNSYMQLTAGNK